MNINEKIKIEITGYDSLGAGIARIGGLVVFIPGAVRGDVLEIEIVKILSKYAYGKILNIVSPSPDRIKPECAGFPNCGGCDFLHISYSAELEYKKNTVLSALKRIGGIEIPYIDIIPSPQINAYRNKAFFSVGYNKDHKLSYGFYREGSHNIVFCGGCPALTAEVNAAAEAVCRYADACGIKPYNEKNGSGLLRGIFVRKAFSNGGLCVCPMITDGSLHKPELLVSHIKFVCNNVTSIMSGTSNGRYETLYGESYLTDTLCGITLRLSPAAFYQVNHAQCENLYNCVLEYCRIGNNIKEANILDLFCGAGSISLFLAKHAKSVLGVEIVSEAIVNAEENARENSIKNAAFVAADADKIAEILKKERFCPDIIVVDPPRKGLGAKLCATLAAIQSLPRNGFCDISVAPRNPCIIYVSCDPATLSRDIKTLSAFGYNLTSAKIFDMFPRTHHVETVVLMSRVDK